MTGELKEKLIAYGMDENYSRLTGLHIVDLDDGRAVIELPVQEGILNRWGTPHGGALFTLCDVACGMANVTLRQESCVTVNAPIDFLAAAPGHGRLTAVGIAERSGGKISFLRAEVYDESGRLVAEAHSVMCFTGGELPL